VANGETSSLVFLFVLCFSFIHRVTLFGCSPLVKTFTADFMAVSVGLGLSS